MPGRHRAAVRKPPDDATRTHALLDAIDLIGSALDLDETLRRTASVARALGQASYASVEVYAEARVRRVDDGDLPGVDDDLVALDLLAHGTVLGRMTVGRAEPGVEEEDRDLVGRLAALVAPLIGNAIAYDESERRRRWLEGTVKVAAALAPTMRSEDTHAQLVAGVRSVADSPLIVLLVRDGSGRGSGQGSQAHRWRLAAADGDEGRALAAVDLMTEQIAAAGDGGQLLCVAGVGGTETLLIPLQTVVAPPGVLLVEDAGISTIGGLERDTLSTFAGQVSLALDRAHAIGERQELLIAADRDRIARDLHDLVIQRLYATGMQLQAARHGDAARMEAAITGSVRELDATIRDLRATIFELGRGPSGGLGGEARALVEEYAAVLGFLPALRISGPVDTALTASVSDEVLLVLREALSNIARHAHATGAHVELTASAAWFMLRVTDNGVGMSVEAGSASGLRNSMRRAEALGGVMRTGSVTPHGTSLVWLVPAAS